MFFSKILSLIAISFTYSSNKYLSNAYYGTTIVPFCTCSCEFIKMKTPALMEFTFQWEINKSFMIRVSYLKQKQNYSTETSPRQKHVLHTLSMWKTVNIASIIPLYVSFSSSHKGMESVSENLAGPCDWHGPIE